MRSLWENTAQIQRVNPLQKKPVKGGTAGVPCAVLHPATEGLKR